MDSLVVAFAGAGEPSVSRLEQRLSDRGWEVTRASDAHQLPALAAIREIALAVLWVPSPDIGEILHLLPEWRQAYPRLRVVLVAATSSEAIVLAALRAGVSDYLRAPVSDTELLESIERASLGARSPRSAGTVPARPLAPGDPMIGNGPAIRSLRRYIERVGRSDSHVLITGETGVGKELVAEMIHACSPRRHKPYVAINCAAIPDTLLESELFGFDRGAFTGAERGREGALRSADGGSVLLDEIGDMGLSAQAKILRAIEARQVHPLGSRSQVPLDVRVMSATNQDLEQLVTEGRFRKDLYYRLNVARIHLPPLRERLDDLEALIAHYVQYFNRRFGRRVEGFTTGALAALRQYEWPGNVRELKNLIEALFVDLDGAAARYVDLPDAFRRRLAGPRPRATSERERLIEALFVTKWNKSKAAADLHWSRMTLYRKLAKYNVVREPTS